VTSANVHIFYYPWYGNPTTSGEWIHWNQNGHTPPADIASSFYPVLGAYDSLDPAIVDQHMAWIAQAGAGVVVTSWWGQHSREDSAVPVVLDRAAAHGLAVAFHLEPYTGRTATTFFSDVQYLNSMYGSHPAFYRAALPSANGPSTAPRPLFYVYAITGSDSATDWAYAIKYLRAGGQDATFLGQQPTIAPQAMTSLVQSYSLDGAYNYVYWTGGFAPIVQALTGIGALFSASVAPGFDNTRAVSGGVAYPRQQGAVYQSIFEQAIAANPALYSITSFNEWHEGTQIEPAQPHTVSGYTSSDYSGAAGETDPADRTAYLTITADILPYLPA
jgi:glycoprotein endo-alpha-1,2-mannosidase